MNEVESSLICVCNHPKNWHEAAGRFTICYGKFCKCPHFNQTLFKYDSEKWIQLNNLEMVKNKKEKINLTNR